MISELLSMSYNSMRRRKLRTALTLLGIIIGVSAVVALISVGQGMQMSINKMFESMGSDKLIISPGGGFSSGITPATSGLSASKLYEHDVDIINGVSGIEYAFGMVTDTAKLKFGGETKYLSVYGVPADSKTKAMTENIEMFKIQQGRSIEENDRYKVVIGNRIADSVFDKDVKVGDDILIDDVEFTVVGIFKKSGSPIYDRMVAINIDAARELFNKSEEVGTIFAQVKNGLSPSKVALDVEKDMRNDRNLEKGKEDFTVSSSEQIISGVNAILGAVQAVLIGIAAISLLVGGVGIMNTMYTSVMEQTSNIGLMKAVGARSHDIMILFILESGLVGLIGGIVGVCFGAVLGKIVEIVAVGAGVDIFKAIVTPELVAGALAFSFIIGTISGLLPARHASKLDPVEALRYR
ncbi:MAG: ABC transporter permease [Candidatus Aenigmatarchaeota archaeon]